MPPKFDVLLKLRRELTATQSVFQITETSSDTPANAGNYRDFKEA